MTVSTVVKLNSEERKALIAAVDVLQEILDHSKQYSDMYYSGGYFDHLDLDTLSEMNQTLYDLANAEDLELEP